jgi:deazaflavin-dependent oxidoreductase (nitroreductase family)
VGDDIDGDGECNGGMADTTHYRKPPWIMRNIGNKLSPLFRPGMVARLAVPGRTSGRWRTTPIVVLEHGGDRYLVAPGGHTHWARNLSAARRGRLLRWGHVEEITAAEVPVAERAPIIAEYRRRFGKMPTVDSGFQEYPDPADHPTFRISGA